MQAVLDVSTGMGRPEKCLILIMGSQATVASDSEIFWTGSMAKVLEKKRAVVMEILSEGGELWLTRI